MVTLERKTEALFPAYVSKVRLFCTFSFKWKHQWDIWPFYVEQFRTATSSSNNYVLLLGRGTAKISSEINLGRMNYVLRRSRTAICAIDKIERAKQVPP